ncbi:hypothetical protein KCO_05593 [Pectobacterium brasiliense ICMP 19477]|nr:hypothetical protein KCO_05593 [Pectobacterium brasiliense ICMP 19477]
MTNVFCNRRYNSAPLLAITFLYQSKLFFFERLKVPVPSSCLST